MNYRFLTFSPLALHCGISQCSGLAIILGIWQIHSLMEKHAQTSRRTFADWHTLWWTRTYMNTSTHSASLPPLSTPGHSYSSPLVFVCTLCIGAHAQRRTHAHLTSCINRNRAGRRTTGLSLMFLRLSGSLTLTSCDFTVILYATSALWVPIREIVWDNQNNINFSAVL